MFSLSVVTIPSVALRYRCGRAFSHSPTLVQVDATTMARLQADSALLVQQLEVMAPAANTDAGDGQNPPTAKAKKKQGKD